MPDLSANDKVKRRPATYGKTSRRVLVGFQGNQNEGDHSTHDEPTCVQETIVGRVRKAGPRRRPQQGRQADERKPSPASSLSSLVHDMKPAPDLYDVPSSDEDRPVVRMRPVVKKRKVQDKRARRVAQAGSNPDTSSIDEAKSTEVPPWPAKSARHDVGGVGSIGISTRLSEPNDSSTLSTWHGPYMKTAERGEPASVIRSGAPRRHQKEPLLSATPPPRPKNKPQSSLLADRTQLVSQAEPKHTRTTVVGPPKTPPSAASIRRLTSGGITQSFSPSGLDIPSLSLKGIGLRGPSQLVDAENASLHRAIGQPMHSPRKKLKDRMATRDGSRPQDSPTDSDGTGEETSDDDDAEGVPCSSISQTDPLASDTGNPQHTNRPIAPMARRRPHLAPVGPKITYIARERSLRKEDSSDAMLMDLSLTSGRQSPKQSRRLELDHMASSQTTNTHHGDVSDHDSDEASAPIAALRSIHELRQAGVNARVVSEAETVLDDIACNTVSLKRSGLLDLAAKLRNQNFKSYFVNNGFVARFVAYMDTHADILTRILFSVSILQLVAHDNSPQALAIVGAQSMLKFLLQLIAESTDMNTVSKERSANVTKAMRKDIEDLNESLSSSQSLWRCGRPRRITSRFVALQCLEYIVRHVREGGSTAEVLSQESLNMLLETLSSMTTTTESATPSYQDPEVRLILSILESSTLGLHSSSMKVEQRWSHRSIFLITSFLDRIQHYRSEVQGTLWSLALRFCLNLTSTSDDACDIFAARGAVEHVLPLIEAGFSINENEHTGQIQDVMLDNAILSLGFLITLAARGPENRLHLLNQGSLPIAPLDTLLHIFATKWQTAFQVTAEDELKKSIPLGYLAALLTYLSIDAEVRQLVASRLEGGNIKHLIIAVHEFLKIYKQAEEIKSVENDVDLRASFVDKLQVVLDQLRDECLL